MTEALLGLDIGTSTTKGVLFNAAGKELARASSEPYQNRAPHPGWMEQDPEELWRAVVTVLDKLSAQIDGDIERCALCMAAQSGSLLPVDAGRNPVYPLITWMDGRTEGLVRRWRDEGIQEQVRAISGWSLHPGLCLPTIAWLRQHDPDTFAAARHYFSVNDFIAYRLTGAICTNPSNAGGMQLPDIRTGMWSESLCQLAGIGPDQLSPIWPSGTIVGEITPEVRRLTGLPSGAILVNGGHDQGCAALGMNVTTPGRLLLACGTAWVLTGVTNAPDMTDIPEILDVNFHAVEGRWTTSCSLGGLGASLEWWVGQAWQGIARQALRPEIYAALNEELAQTNPASNGLHFLPLTGGHDDPATTRRGAFVGLHLGHGRADMARSIMEGAAFELRWLLEDVERAGFPVEQLWMVGGAAQSPLWSSILADVTGVPIRLPSYENWPALGAAVLAGVGSGVFESLEAGLARFQKPERRIVPNAAPRALYDESFETYKELVRSDRWSIERMTGSR